MADSPSRRRSTPSRASSSSSALLVPASIARPSMSGSRFTPSKLFSNDNKENASTPNSRTAHHSTSNSMPYDAFMSPLKSAMKVYPVMSPLKKRRISFASPLRQCSPNTSIRSQISERDEQDTTMTGATASVLDDLFMDEEQHEQGDRAQMESIQEGPPAQEEEPPMPQESTASTSQSLSCSPSASNSLARTAHENVTFDATARSAPKQSQISSFSTSSDEMDASEEPEEGVPSTAFTEQAQQEDLVNSSPDLTALAANIPLPPSPVKAVSTSAPTPKTTGSPKKSRLLSTITKVAASVPLPDSPAIDFSVALQQLQSRASPKKATAAVEGTPLLDRTAQAALIPLPQSVSRPTATSGLEPSTADDPQESHDTACVAQIMPFADQANVDSPVKMPSSTLHQLPFSRARVVPSPAKQQSQGFLHTKDTQIDHKSILPFAEADSIDSPVKHATGPNPMATLRHMPFVNEDHIPSPVKQQSNAAQTPSCADEAEDQSIKPEESRDQTEVLIATLNTSMLPEAPEEETNIEVSGITISEAGSPLHTNGAEPEMLVDLDGECAGSAGKSDGAVHSAPEDDLENEKSLSVTPARLIKAIPGHATPSAYGPRSETMESTTHAPATKKRTLSRMAREVSQPDLSISSNLSLSDTSATSSSKDEINNIGASSMSLQGGKKDASDFSSSSRYFILKREARDPSPASRTESPSAESSQEPVRRITRQRSLTALQEDQAAAMKTEVASVEASAEAGASTVPILGKRKGRIIQEDEQEGAPDIKKAPPRTRRQSTRLAGTSGLPQPSSRIARKATTPKAQSATSSNRSLKTEKKQGPVSSDDEEEQMPTVASRPTISTREISQVGHDNAETPAPAIRRPQRSARPARNLAVDAKPLPSPRRAVSPVKKPLRAARAVNGAISSTKSDATAKEGTSEAQSSGRSLGRVPLRSPGRVLLSPAKTNIQQLRSPGRALAAQVPRSPHQNGGSTFDWSSVPPQNQAARMPQTLSPERYRKTASKIFGSVSESSVGASSASSGPASSAASATGLSSQTSPLKGLAQRLTLSGSPSLLGISVAPELLVLAPPSPSPTKLNSQLNASTAPSFDGPSMLSASTSSAPESRRLSTPAQSTPSGVSPLQSPRRALSAQPAGAVPRDKLPSPRRVLPITRHVPTTSIAAGSGTPIRTASRVFPTLTSKSLLTGVPQGTGEQAGAASVSDVGRGSVAGEAPRRSQRSARPQRAVQAIKKENVPTALSSSGAPNNTKAAVTPAQLQTLTNQNTSANRKLYNKHKVTVIYKDEDRPPSPTSKIRKTGDQTPKENRAVRSALAQGTRLRRESYLSSNSVGEKRPHFSAAGDEGIYESPIKKMRLEKADARDGNVQQKTKSLKWDRDLLKPNEKLYTPSDHGTAAKAKVPSRPVVKNKALNLDGFGNVPDCKASLSPIVPRTKVEISKIIYRDDDLDDDEE